MHVKSKSGRAFRLPSGAEAEAIRAGRDADGDAFTLDEFQRMRPIGRPKAVFTKERISIRLSPEVVCRFRATGPGWQTRMNAALQDWLKDHTPEEAA